MREQKKQMLGIMEPPPLMKLSVKFRSSLCVKNLTVMYNVITYMKK